MIFVTEISSSAIFETRMKFMYSDNTTTVQYLGLSLKVYHGIVEVKCIFV